MQTKHFFFIIIYLLACLDDTLLVVILGDALDSGQCLATVPLLNTNVYQAVLNAVVGTLDRIREGIWF